MNFEEMFKSWTLDQKVEWALGPNICNLSNEMQSIFVDLWAENKLFIVKNKQLNKENSWLRKDRAFAWNENEKNCELNCTIRKENVKLKCLALHLFKVVGYNESKDWGRIRDCFGQESKLKQRCSRNSDRWRRIANKCHEAYIKAKAELKEGK